MSLSTFLLIPADPFDWRDQSPQEHYRAPIGVANAKVVRDIWVRCPVAAWVTLFDEAEEKNL